jgi:hypothetical protein
MILVKCNSILAHSAEIQAFWRNAGIGFETWKTFEKAYLNIAVSYSYSWGKGLLKLGNSRIGLEGAARHRFPRK